MAEGGLGMGSQEEKRFWKDWGTSELRLGLNICKGGEGEGGAFPGRSIGF